MTPRETLTDFLSKEAPDLVIEVTEFDSGAFDIHVRGHDRVFVVQRAASGVIGVSELVEDGPEFGGHDHEFLGLEEALSYLRKALPG